MKTLDFSETIEACDLKVGRYRQLIKIMKVCGNEGQGHFFTIYFSRFLYVLCFTRPRYQVSVYRTIGPLVCRSFLHYFSSAISNNLSIAISMSPEGWSLTTGLTL